MSKVQNFAGLTQSLPFTEFDFYESYRQTFEKTELGRMRKLLPLHQMAETFGLVNKSLQPKRGRKSYFTPEVFFCFLIFTIFTEEIWMTDTVENNGRIYLYIALAGDGGYFRHNEYRELGCNYCRKRV